MAQSSFRHRTVAFITTLSIAMAPLTMCGCTGEQHSSPTEDTSFVSETSGEGGASTSEMLYADDGGTLYPIDFNTEEYGELTEAGFISTTTRPLSTVSADVDTASWCNLRRMVNDGYRMRTSSDDESSYGIIPTGAVRIEEMLNYFTYDYAVPEAGSADRFAVTTHLGPCPWNEKTELLTMGFATTAEDTVTAKGRNLVFLIDISGSMNSSDKLDLLQDSFGKLVEHLDENDRVSIVTYASKEELVLDGAAGNDSRTILRAINRLKADGATNGERGLEMAYEVAERNFIEGGVNRIVMASDGDLNVGMTSESDLHDYVSKKRETGIYLSVLGFGTGNYKDTKMETLADDGNGSYHYIDCIEEAERVFGERLCANLVPFADDVKVQVEFNPEQVKAYRLIGYENRALADEDFRNDAVDAGDVGPQSQFTVAYEIVRADSDFEVGGTDLKYQNATTTGSDEWLTATMRYHVFDDDTMHEQEVQVSEKDWNEHPGDDWNFQASIIEFGMLLRDSEYRGTSSIDSVRELAGKNHDDFLRVVELA